MNTEPLAGGDADPLRPLFQCLANGDRRHLLRIVSERSSAPATPDELAKALVSAREGKPRDGVTDAERRAAAVDLHHAHLPALEAVELIERDAEGAVAVVDHPALRDEGIREAIATEGAADAASRDALFAALADARRRTILDVLSHQYQAVQTETLAREVAAKERDMAERDVPTEAVDRLLVPFQHAHLPALRDAGLIEYDAEERTVAYGGHPLLRVPWMHSRLEQDFRASLTESAADEDVWTIEERERIVSYGQSLCEAADDELFLLFTATGLLETGCFDRIRRAADDGVDVYLGTADPTVREFVAENAPDVTLWEPQRNWLDFPIAEGNVGRLVFADRKTVMLGTLGAKDDEGVHEEKAIAGDGTDNPLVVMLRQMLRPQLEQFDADAAELDLDLSL